MFRTALFTSMIWCLLFTTTALGQVLLQDVLNGPSSIGEFQLTPATNGQPEYLLRYADLDMDFMVKLENQPRVWRVSRPDGSVLARYTITSDNFLVLLNGQGTAAGAVGSDSGDDALEPDASSYVPNSPEETWLFDFETLIAQQKGRPGITTEGVAQACAVQYADLVVSGLMKGARPLMAIQLMQAEWPEPFNLIGQPAYEERAAHWWYLLRQSDLRKQEGEFLKGNFAIVSPDLGISLAASSGWIALASAAYSPEEGFTSTSALPYGMTLNGAWDTQGVDLLPGYWTFLQQQDAGPEGSNHIYTTPMLPGLALIMTQSPDSTALIGATIVYQQYMQGVAPPRMLPHVSAIDEAAYYARTLFWNASLDWALFGDAPDNVTSLTPPGFVWITSEKEGAEMASGSVAPNSTAGLRGGRVFTTQRCPGSESPVQILCGDNLVQQIKMCLPDDYQVRIRFLDQAGQPVQDGRSAAVVSAKWLIVHLDDRDKSRSEYRYPHLLLTYRQDPGAPSANGKNGSFSAVNSLELAAFPAQERF